MGYFAVEVGSVDVVFLVGYAEIFFFGGGGLGWNFWMGI
jgi:hypothetical protein